MSGKTHGVSSVSLLNAKWGFTILIIFALATVVQATLISGCGGGGLTSNTTTNNNNNTTGGLLAAGTTAPDFECANLTGGTLRLSSLRGKAVLLVFWYTG
jgi:cytochrome oxidase Cu insertion factor (SCO1/SenC/PrrC family)